MPSARPHHLLCDGFRKHVGPRQHPCSVQGLYSIYPNERVASLKQMPWQHLLSLLGRAGEGMMINMLLDCAIFIPIQIGQSNYYQLSGQKPFLGSQKMCLTSGAGSPIFESDPISNQIVAPPIDVAGGTAALERKPTDIQFVRSRMLYARATLNARGMVHFGLRHIRE